jgi:hypothetical protein
VILSALDCAQLGEALDWQFTTACPLAAFAAWLCETALHVRLPSLKKHPRGPKKPQQKPPYDPKQPDVSIHQLLKAL